MLHSSVMRIASVAGFLLMVSALVGLVFMHALFSRSPVVVAIQVEALDRQKLLRDVATVFSDNHVNIVSAASAVGKDRITTLRFVLELADITHLSRLLAAVKSVDAVFDAYRVVPR